MIDILYSIFAGVLVFGGVYLLMSNHLTRLVAGLIALSHGVNLALLISGGLTARRPPFAEKSAQAAPSLGEVADPLPQALILTAIVITFSLVAFAVVVYRRYFEETGEENVGKGGSL